MLGFLIEVKEVIYSGGWVMIPLFLLAVLLYTQALELMLHLLFGGLNDRKRHLWREWVNEPEKAEGQVGQIITYTQGGASTSRRIRNHFDEVRVLQLSGIDQQLAFVNCLVAAAPLMGLLGTVLGILKTFFGIATTGGAETLEVVASGISEALITTATGLIIALPGLFMAMLIQRQRHKMEACISHLESITLTCLKTAE